MRVLIIGYSAIVRKRVIPALRKLQDIEEIDIATRSKANTAAQELPTAKVFTDYQKACRASSAELVYVSLVNSEHVRWAEEALRTGRHVIVDKPAFTKLADAQRLADFATKKNLCLAEATVYAWHLQIEKTLQLFHSKATSPTRITTTFCFPPLPENNFRYQKHLGGGALFDLGPYAISPGRIFFHTEPEEIFCRICTRHPQTGVDTAFSILAIYPGGRSLVGHFDFNTEYRNYLNVLGHGMSVDIDRVFTTPSDMDNTLVMRTHNTVQPITVPAADAFALFFTDVSTAIQKKSFTHFTETLVSDARVLHKMRAAAQED